MQLSKHAAKVGILRLMHERPNMYKSFTVLSQLEACCSPADKAAILVAAHKIVVDGLSRLPPIRLMTEEESKEQKAKAAEIAKAANKQLADAPPKEADGSLKILLPPNSPDTSTIPSKGSASLGSGTSTAKPLSATKQAAGAVDPLVPSPLKPTIPTIVEPKPEPEKSSQDVIVPPTRQSSLPIVESPTSIVEDKPTSLTLAISQKPASTPVSGDVLLPMIIFAVVKANPPKLVSNLLFTQRYRNQSVGGEESYCLVNLMAVAEFLENVDLAALGLNDVDKVLRFMHCLCPLPAHLYLFYFQCGGPHPYSCQSDSHSIRQATRGAGRSSKQFPR
jgi:hypothetical protein